jgi:F0F1-type ATP synthase membrane subunit b/b'
MEILSQTELLITNSELFKINTDLFETNIVNQIILIPIIFYAYSSIGIDKILEKRKNDIIEKVEDSEKRLIEAKNRLGETKKQLEQAYLIFEEIQKETKSVKNNLLNIDYIKTKNELIRRFTKTKKNLKNKERLIFLEVKEYIAYEGLHRIVNNSSFKSDTNSYLEKNIKFLNVLKLNNR